jgi:glycosyltransferase involved in cell wall biosynthesis
MTVPLSGTFGFNVIGNVSSNSGLGVHARCLVTTLLRRGCPISILDLDPGSRRQGFDSTFKSYTVQAPRDLQHGVNFFVLQPSALFATMAKFPEAFLATPKLNVGLIMWELTVVPKSWLPALSALDVVAAASDFCGSTFAACVSEISMISVPCAVSVPEPLHPSRARFNLPERGVLFATSFEPNSDIQRKNPFAAVDAFLRAFGDDPRAHLVIKVNNAGSDRTAQPALVELMRRCSTHRTIHVLDAVMTYQEVLSLYATCDVFVSLHRAEGLGLALMEAMLLGKPVIATGWSGNTTFMNHSNSCLVGYHLIPVEGSLPVYRRDFLGVDALWAEPYIDEAVTWMHRLAADEALRNSIGNAAVREMIRYRDIANEAAYVDELRAIWSQRAFLPARDRRRSISVRCLWEAAGSRHASLGRRLKNSVSHAAERHLLWRLRSR